jgi:hypothetical protein
MQALLSSGQDELKAAYQKAVKVGELSKARVLEGFMKHAPSEKVHSRRKQRKANEKTRQPRPSSFRAASVPMAGLTVQRGNG